jgi:outer membrane protein assembly factor BamD
MGASIGQVHRQIREYFEGSFMLKSHTLTLIFMFFTAITACSQKDFNPSDPADVFAAAKEPYDDGLFDIAVQKLGEFTARFPYSNLTPKAELLIANSHFELGSYAEAAVSYEQFVKLHPNHEQADFAMFRVGESFWIEAPEDIDREQDFTQKAVNEWERLIEAYPNSKYSIEAKQRIKAGLRRIAESFDFIAAFYCKQELYHACAYRSVQILERYPEFKDLRKKSLKRAATSFAKLAKEKTKKPDADSNIYLRSMSTEQLLKKSKEFESMVK